MIKLIIPALICLMLAFPVHAEQLPEPYIVNQELKVEDESNIIKDNLNGRREDDFVIEERTTVFMSAKECFKRITLPALLIFGSGLVLFFYLELKDVKKSKKDSD